MATMTLPRVQTYRIYYNTGAAEEAGADGAVYCGAKKKHMAQWQYDMTALQTERAGRDIIITRATVSWQTSSTSTYDIRVQDARCYGRGAGVYLGDAKGTSTSSMQWISTSRAAPHDSITLIQNTINGGATAIYISCQNESTSSNVYGTCQYGTLTIEYEYATPLTVIEYLVADKTMIALGESVGVSASIRNITESEISAVQLQVVRDVDGADVAIGDAVSVDVTIPAAETALINQTLTIPAWANPARATQLYVQVSITGADYAPDTLQGKVPAANANPTDSSVPLVALAAGSSATAIAEKAALCTALDARYNPTIETFSVSRATQHPIDGWIKSDNGVNTMTDLKIDLGSGATGFTMKVYYGTGEIDTSTAQSIDLTSRISDAIAGMTNATGVIEKPDGWALGSAWNFLLVLTDGYESAQMGAQIGIAFTNMHLAGLTTGGVRFGGYCTRSEQGKPAFECSYPIYADGGIASMDYSTTETKMPYKWIDGKDVYRVVCTTADSSAWAGREVVFSAITDAETIISMTGAMQWTDGQVYQIPYTLPTDADHAIIAYFGNDKCPRVKLAQVFSYISRITLIVEYTKGA